MEQTNHYGQRPDEHAVLDIAAPFEGERSRRVWRGSDRIFRGRNMNWKSFPINSEAFESPE